MYMITFAASLSAALIKSRFPSSYIMRAGIMAPSQGPVGPVSLNDLNGLHDVVGLQQHRSQRRDDA
jgi:hypothetical protein